MNIEKTEIKCPFCNKGEIICLYTPSFWQEKRSITATFGSRRQLKKSKEKYEVQSDCPKCGKKAKEIQKILNEGKEDTEKEKKIFERLKAQGIIKDEMTTKF